MEAAHVRFTNLGPGGADQLRDGVDPRRLGVQRGNQQQLLAAERAPLVAGADADLLDGLEAIGDERGTEDREALPARLRELGEHEVGVGVDPGRAAEARLEGYRVALRAEAEA